MRPRPDAMRPRSRPRPERVRPRLRPRPNDLTGKPSPYTQTHTLDSLLPVDYQSARTEQAGRT